MMFNYTLVTPRRLTGAYLTALARSLYGEKTFCRFNRNGAQQPVGWYLYRSDDPTLLIGQNIDAAYAYLISIVDSIESAEWLFSHKKVDANAKWDTNYPKFLSFGQVFVKSDEITASDLVHRVRHACGLEPQPLIKIKSSFYRVTDGVYTAGGMSSMVGLRVKNIKTGTLKFVTKREGSVMSLYEAFDSASKGGQSHEKSI